MYLSTSSKMSLWIVLPLIEDILSCYIEVKWIAMQYVNMYQLNEQIF